MSHENTVNVVNERTKIPLFAAITASVVLIGTLTTVLIYVIPAVAKNSEQDARLDRQAAAISELRADIKTLLVNQADANAKLQTLIEMQRRHQ